LLRRSAGYGGIELFAIFMGTVQDVFCHSERTLNMRNLRHHLLMEEDRKLSQ